MFIKYWFTFNISTDLPFRFFHKIFYSRLNSKNILTHISIIIFKATGDRSGMSHSNLEDSNLGGTGGQDII